MNERTCIVRRKSAEPDELIRFVAGPDSSVVPDLKRNLPGRGCWVTADRKHVELAVARKLFARALKAEVTVSPQLAETVDALMAKLSKPQLEIFREGGDLAGATASIKVRL